MSKGGKRNQALDILRGIAILLVLLFHYSPSKVMEGGRSGVDLFFVLSGYLIAGLLFVEYRKSGKINMLRFWVRRGLKIYPPFYVLMAFTAAYWFVTKGHESEKMFGEIFFVQNYFPRIWGHTWSLAVEQHFYLILPILIFLLIRKPVRKSNPFSEIPCVFLCLAVLCLGMRILDHSMGIPAERIHIETHLRVDSLFAGVALAYYRHYRPELFARAARKPLWIPGLILIAPAFVLSSESAFMCTVGLTLLYVGYGCILVWAVDRPPSRAATARALSLVGYYSYSIYLWQLPVGTLLFRGRMNLAFFLEGILTSIAFGVAMAQLVEIPNLRLREKLFPGHEPGKKIAPYKPASVATEAWPFS